MRAPAVGCPAGGLGPGTVFVRGVERLVLRSSVSGRTGLRLAEWARQARGWARGSGHSFDGPSLGPVGYYLECRRCGCALRAPVVGRSPRRMARSVADELGRTGDCDVETVSAVMGS